MKKLKMARGVTLTFEEGCNKYLENCRQRNLREGTIEHYRQSYVQFFRYFDPQMPIQDIDESTYKDYVLHLKLTLDNDVSINSYLRDLITTIHFFMNEGWLPHFKMQAIKVDSRKTKTLTRRGESGIIKLRAGNIWLRIENYRPIFQGGKTMKKRIFAIFLAMVLCLPILASCDNKTPDVESTDNLPETVVDSTSETESQSESKPETDKVTETESKTEMSDNSYDEDEDEDDKKPSDEEDENLETDSETSDEYEDDETENEDEDEDETQKPSSSDASVGLEYSLIDGAYEVVGIGSCNDKNIVIPNKYKGLPVISIRDYAFENNSQITSVKLSSSIEAIGDGAFSGCVSLKKVTLSSRLLSIGKKAFYGCVKLESISIPESVQSIGKLAFRNCDNLAMIIYNGTVSDANGLFFSTNVEISTVSVICFDGTLIFDTPIKEADYNTSTSDLPSNWNELNYTDTNATQIMGYIASSFFEYDFKFVNDQKFLADGQINKDGIIPGGYTTNYSAAKKLEDVTAMVDAKWGYTIDQKRKGGYAWKITLRDDLRWDDGTPITAADFVWSMKQLLDPDFMHYRADTYINTVQIKNSRAYFFQNTDGTYETIGSLGYSSLADALATGETLYINIWNMWETEGYVDVNGNECPEYVSITDMTVWDTPDAWTSGTAFDAVWGEYIYQHYSSYLEPGTGYDACIYVENTNRDVEWENVGIYSIDDENAIVICLDSPYYFLNDDGSLSYRSAYYMSGLPLVHREKYESSKVAPKNRGDLWTTTYCTSVETTASWGPYTLVAFDGSSHYRLEKNEFWFGWNMPEYKNQYNVNAINCYYVPYWEIAWDMFISGDLDDTTIANTIYSDYSDSKYVYYTSTATGTFGIQLYSNLDVLKESGNNNGILAIPAFRHAINLALDRSDVVSNIWPGTSVPCFGLVNSAYYYDVENASTLPDGGQYRNTKLAKEGILRAYGYVQSDDGTWGTGDISGLTLEEAYASLTGYNPALAREKLLEAIEELTNNADYYGYDPDRNITLVYGASINNDTQRFRADYLQGILDELTRGTALEDKIVVKFDASAGDQWADAFRTGATQIGFGYGFSGNAFDPFDIIGVFVNPYDSLNFHGYWDTSAIDMTITLPDGEYEGAGETITMSVLNWYFCLNGLAEGENQPMLYNFDAYHAPSEARLTILSAIEELVIKESRSIMLIADGGGNFISAKFSYITDVENTFMGFGGMRYIEVNYTDEEWVEFVDENGHNLSEVYKETK